MTGSGRKISTARSLDASMDLLNQIIRQPIDPDYAARRGPRGAGRPRSRGRAGPGRGSRSEPCSPSPRCRPPGPRRPLETERAELIDRVQAPSARRTEQLQSTAGRLDGRDRPAADGGAGRRRRGRDPRRSRSTGWARSVGAVRRDRTRACVIVVDDAPAGEHRRAATGCSTSICRCWPTVCGRPGRRRSRSTATGCPA